MRQKEVALGVHGQVGVKLKRAPQAHLDVVAHGHGVVGVELGGALAGKGAGEQVGAKHITGLVGRVVPHLRWLGALLWRGRGGCRGFAAGCAGRAFAGEQRTVHAQWRGGGCVGMGLAGQGQRNGCGDQTGE